jgi:hypothetical protein
VARYRTRTLVSMAAPRRGPNVQRGLRRARGRLSGAGTDYVDATSGPVATDELAAAPSVPSRPRRGRIAEGGMRGRRWRLVARRGRDESEIGECCSRRALSGSRRRRQGDAEVPVGGTSLVQRRPGRRLLARGWLRSAGGKDKVGVRQELNGARAVEGVEAGAKSGRLWHQHGIGHGVEGGEL